MIALAYVEEAARFCRYDDAAEIVDLSSHP